MSGEWQRVGMYWEIVSPAAERSITFSLDEYIPRGSKVTGVKLTYSTNDSYADGDALFELITYDSVGGQSTAVQSYVALAKSTTANTPMKKGLAVSTRLLMSDGKETMIRVRYSVARGLASMRVLGINVTYTYTNRPQPYPLTRLVAIAGALAVVARAPQLLWEWNGVDTSQFESSALYVSGGTTPANNDTPSLTVVSDAAAVPYGAYLRFRNLNATGFTGGRVWLIKQTFPLEYTIEMEFRRNGTSGVDAESIGLAMLGREVASQYTGLMWTSPEYAVCEDGAFTQNEAFSTAANARITPLAGSPSYNRATVRLQAVKAAGAAPTWRITNAQHGVTSVTTSGTGAYVAQAFDTQETFSALGATWNGSACNRLGFAHAHVTVAAFDQDLHVYRMRVYAGSA